jgi:hypothetical protein
MFGRTAPELSVTVPEIVPVAPDCANSLLPQTSRMISTIEYRNARISRTSLESFTLLPLEIGCPSRYIDGETQERTAFPAMSMTNLNAGPSVPIRYKYCQEKYCF